MHNAVPNVMRERTNEATLFPIDDIHKW